MSSHPHNELIRNPQLERPRRLRPTGRRLVAAVAIGFGLASASVSCGAISDPTYKTVAQATDSATPVPARTSGAFVLRIRRLEARGYLQASCNSSGILMVNPRTHRREIVVA